MSSVPNDEHKDDWIAKSAANGVEYYYNIKTKKSQWEKPDSLKNPEERLNSTGWQEHVRADGKVFYHNPKLNQSTWKMPPEIKALKEKQAELRKQSALQGDSSSLAAGSKITVSLTSNMEFLDDDTGAEEIPHEEAVRIFMGLLRERVPPTLKWDQVHQLLHEEERYKIIKSMATKRKLYKDWVNQTKQQEKNEMRAKIEKAKDNFRQMLEEKKILTSDSKFHKVAHVFMNDYRWKALEDKDRENIFQDYLDELFENEKQEKRQKKKTLSEAIRKAFLEDSRISSETTWSQINDLYRNDQRWQGLEDYDKLTIFCEHILDLDRKEREDKRRIRKLKERKNREAFRDLLNEYTEKGKLTHKTKWRNFVEIIQDESRLLNMLGQPGSTPRELFEDKVEFLKDQHKKIKEELKKMIKDSDFKFTTGTEIKDFLTFASSNSEFSHLTDSIKEYYYNYFMEKGKSKDKENQKKKKKMIKKFTKFLKHIENLNKDSQYSDFEKMIEENLEFSQLTSDEKKACFTDYIQQKNNEDDGQISDKEGEKSKKKKSKKKKNKNKKKRESNEDSSNESGHESKSRSRSKSHERKSKKKNKEKLEEDKYKEDDKDKIAQDDKISKSLNFETKIAGEEPKPIEENNQLNPQPEITNNTADQNSLQQEVQPTTITTEQIIDPDQEEGEERNVLRIIKKKISKSSSRSDSDQRSKKKKEKKHSKKKSKKSDKKNKKKKNKKSSSRSDSSDSEN